MDSKDPWSCPNDRELTLRARYEIIAMESPYLDISYYSFRIVLKCLYEL